MIAKLNTTRSLIHFRIYYGSLCLLMLTLPVSRFLVTLSLMIIIVNWVAEGNFTERLKGFASFKPAVAFTFIYALNVAGLLWSKDLGFAFTSDLLHKSPALFLPIIMVSSPVPDIRKIRLLLFLFISSVVIVSFIGILNTVLRSEISFREASPFIPGIYYGMMLLIAAFQLPFLLKQVTKNRILLFAGLSISLWLIFFLFYLRSLSGIASFAGILIFITVYLIFRLRSIIVKILFASLFTAIAIYVLWSANTIFRQTHLEVETDFRTLQGYTELGNNYYHDTTSVYRENGHLVLIYIAEEELRDHWHERSKFDFYESDKTGMALHFTLYRYLTSKGLRKDKQGLMQLSEEDIASIERGITNYLLANRSGFYIRVHEEMAGLYRYRESSYREASTSSLTERLEQWRASWVAFKKHPLLGWGTGSIFKAVNWGFEKNNSVLTGRNMKPHNQYMYILLTLGVAGIIAYILLYSYIVVKTGVYKLFMFKIFLLVFFINFLANNSFEGQLGHIPFVFFTLFYIYYYPHLKTSQASVY
jgi:hypothetical protein